jgi:nicotinamidase-related amidase
MAFSGDELMNDEALLIIDVQKGLVKGAYREQEVLAAISQSIARIRERKGLIIFIQHCSSGWEPLKKGNEGWAVHASLDMQDGDHFIEKEASDSFYESGLDELLQSNGITHVFVTGLQSEYCVDATCRAALSKGYGVTLVSDAHTTGDAHLSAASIIDHHNKILPNLAHPDKQITLLTSSEI